MRVSKHALFACSAIALAAAMPHAAKADQISQLQAQINALSAKLAAIHSRRVGYRRLATLDQWPGCDRPCRTGGQRFGPFEPRPCVSVLDSWRSGALTCLTGITGWTMSRRWRGANRLRPVGWGQTGRNGMALRPLDDLLEWHGPGGLPLQRPILKKQQGRNRPDSVSGQNGGCGVGVQFDQAVAWFEPGGCVDESGCHCPARSAPRCPEVGKNRDLIVLNMTIEPRVVDLKGMAVEQRRVAGTAPRASGEAGRWHPVDRLAGWTYQCEIGVCHDCSGLAGLSGLLRRGDYRTLRSRRTRFHIGLRRSPRPRSMPNACGTARRQR